MSVAILRNDKDCIIISKFGFANLSTDEMFNVLHDICQNGKRLIPVENIEDFLSGKALLESIRNRDSNYSFMNKALGELFTESELKALVELYKSTILKTYPWCKPPSGWSYEDSWSSNGKHHYHHDDTTKHLFSYEELRDLWIYASWSWANKNWDYSSYKKIGNKSIIVYVTEDFVDISYDAESWGYIKSIRRHELEGKAKRYNWPLPEGFK